MSAYGGETCLARSGGALGAADLPCLGIGSHVARFVAAERKVLGAACIVGLATLAVYALTACKELLAAHRFGASDQMDCFLVAIAVPTLLTNVFGTPFQTALIPAYVRAREIAGPDEAARLFEGALLATATVLCGIVGAAAVGAGRWLPLVAPGFPATKLALAHSLLMWVLPVALVRSLVKTCAAALTAGGSFAAAALAPAATPIFTILLVLSSQRAGAYALAAGACAGAACEAAVIIPALRRAGLFRAPRWHGWSPGLGEAGRQYVPAFLSTLLMAGTVLADQMMASTRGSGSIAVLSYGTYVVLFLQQIASVALNTAVLPTFSQLAVERDWKGMAGSVRRIGAAVGITAIPVTIALILLSGPLVRLLFQHGSFAPRHATAAAAVQVCYALQIPFYIWNTLVLRCAVAVSWNALLFWGAIFAATLKLILSWLLLPHMGLPGLALATSAMYALSLVFHTACLWVRFRRQKP